MDHLAVSTAFLPSAQCFLHRSLRSFKTRAANMPLYSSQRGSAPPSPPQPSCDSNESPSEVPKVTLLMRKRWHWCDLGRTAMANRQLPMAQSGRPSWQDHQSFSTAPGLQELHVLGYLSASNMTDSLHVT